jgi:hypothetical protein
MTDLYSEILEFKKMKNIDRDQLISDFANDIVGGMDVDTLTEFVYNTIVENISNLSDNELTEQVEAHASYLLDA